MSGGALVTDRVQGLPARSRSLLESRAMLVAAVGATAGFLVGLLAFGTEGVAPAGSLRSTGATAAWTAGGIAAVTLVVTHGSAVRSSDWWRSRPIIRRLLDGLGLTLACVVIPVLLIAAGSTLAHLALNRPQLSPLPAGLLCAGAVAGTAYAVFLFASRVTPRRVAALLVLFTAAGTLAGLLGAGRATWWTGDVAGVGSPSPVSASEPDLILMVAGLLAALLADYLTIDCDGRRGRGPAAHGTGVVRALLIAAGVALTGVGAIPADRPLHGVALAALAVAIAALLTATPWLLDGLPRGFAAASGVLLALVVIVLALSAPAGPVAMRALELLTGGVLSTWLVLLVRSAAAARDANPADPLPFVATADSLPAVPAADEADANRGGGAEGREAGAAGGRDVRQMPAPVLPRRLPSLHVAVDEGDGPPVVLVHGVASSYLTFANVIPLLGGTRVIAVDLLGFGGSPAPPSATFTLEEHVAYLERTLARLRIGEPFVLAGHSLGALIASRYAAKHPRRVRGVVLVSPPIYLPPEVVGNPIDRKAMEVYSRVYGYLRREKDFTLRHAARLAKSWPIEHGFEVTEQNWRPFALSLENAIQTQTAIADIAAVRRPIHVVYGTLDPVLVPGALRIVEQMRHVTTHRIEGGDHAIRPRAAAVVVEAIRSLTSEVPAASESRLGRSRRSP